MIICFPQIYWQTTKLKNFKHSMDLVYVILKQLIKGNSFKMKFL